MLKIGQKLVCIKPIDDLIKNEIYTVVDFDEIGVSVKETLPAIGKMFYRNRFRPIDNAWVDELLCKLMSEVEADELVSA